MTAGTAIKDVPFLIQIPIILQCRLPRDRAPRDEHGLRSAEGMPPVGLVCDIEVLSGERVQRRNRQTSPARRAQMSTVADARTTSRSSTSRQDLRFWLAQMEAAGEIKHIRGADREREIGGIVDIYQRKIG